MRKYICGFTVLFGLVAFLMVLGAYRLFGPGVSPDSVAYLSTARHLMGGLGFTLYNGDRYLFWPPFYPLLLAGLGTITPWSLPTVAGAVNLGCILGVMGLVGFWISRSIWDDRLAGIGLAGIALSPQLFKLWITAWTEPIFILQCLVVVILLEHYLEKGGIKGLLCLYAAGVVIGLACLTRYLGVTLLIPTFFVLAFLAPAVITAEKTAGMSPSSGPNTRGKIKIIMHFMIICVLALGPLLLWLYRNFHVSGTLSGARSESTYTVWTNFYYTVEALSRSLLPSDWPALIRIALMVAGLVWLAGIVGTLTREFTNKHKFKIWRPVVPSVVFIVGYLVVLNVLSGSVGFSKIGDRFVGPVLIPGFLTILFVLDQWVWVVGKGLPKTVFVLLIVWVAISGIRSYSTMRGCARNGTGGYTRRAWMDSEILKAAAGRITAGKVYCNANPEVVYYVTSLYYRPDAPSDTIFLNAGTLLNNGIKTQGITTSYLLWRGEPDNTFNRIRTAYRMEPILRTADGAFFKINGPAGPRPVIPKSR